MSRFGADTHTTAVALDRLTRDDDAETFADLWRRLALIYDDLCPPVTQPWRAN